MTYRWFGNIERGAAPNTITGTLRDPMGFYITLTGIKTEHGYEIKGEPGPVPSEYRIPLLDDDEK